MFLSKQISTIFISLLLGLSLGLAGCGSGGGSDAPVSVSGTGGNGTGGTGGDTGGGTGGGDPVADPDPDTGGATGFSGVEGPLDPVQDGVSSIVADQVGAALPDPMGSTVICADEAIKSLLDAPDALLVAFAALPGGADPAEAFNGAAGDMSASLKVFAAKLQSTLLILTGQSAACDASTVGGNPFAGTPLEPVGVPLAALIAALESADDGSGSGDDPNLSVVVATIMPLLDQLSAGFALLPAELTGAPVVGGAINAIDVLIADLSALLTNAGAYDSVATQASIESLLNNALGNLLLGVLPIGEIDAATGEDFTTGIQDGIDALTAEFGTGLGMVITPAFNDGLDGALSPILDPVEGLLTQLVNGGEAGNGNPLDGLLAALAGDGVSPLDSFFAMLITGADGTPLEDLVAQFPDGGTGTPVDDLLILVDPANGADLDVVLGALSTLFAGTPLNGILDDILGGLLSLLP